MCCKLTCTALIAATPMQKGQLGHGDLIQRNVPSVVEALAGQEVIAGGPPLPLHDFSLISDARTQLKKADTDV